MSRSRRNRGFVAALALSVPAVLAMLAMIAGTVVRGRVNPCRPSVGSTPTPVGHGHVSG
jgi:hypothetical protein